jgi:Ca2+-binding RTX toxin-like protein
MTTAGSFVTGGRTIGFNIWWAQDNLVGSDPVWRYHFDWTNPEDQAYVCLMYQEPRDIAGLEDLIGSLRPAISTEQARPEYIPTPEHPERVRPPQLTFSQMYGAVVDLVTQGGIAQSCIYAQQFGPDDQLTIQFAAGEDPSYQAEITNSAGAVIGRKEGFADGSNVETDFAVHGEQPHGNPDVTVTTTADGKKTVDFSYDQLPVYLKTALAAPGQDPAVALYRDKAFAESTGFLFRDFDTLILGGGDSRINIHGADNLELEKIKMGGGDTTLESDAVNVTIDLGAGTGTIKHAGRGNVINVDPSGKAIVNVSDDVLVVGAKPTDEIKSRGGALLHGALGRVGSDSAWVQGKDGTEYGINYKGELAIRDALGAVLYIANYAGGPGVAFNQQTAGIYVGLLEVIVSRLIDLTRPFNDTIDGTFKAGNAILYAATGKTFFKADPLVLDLNGDGVHLTPDSAAAPIFDVNSNGFGVRTGWVQSDDGILVHDKNSNGEIDNAGEMFGGPGMFGGEGDMGFDALAAYDTNADGVIDASDPIYAQLQVWRDLDGDAQVDEGELQTLVEAGIASIGVTATEQTGVTNAGNIVSAIGTFTRTDNTTGTIAEVLLTNNPFNSTYLGDTSVSTAAAAMPNLKGFGALADLHVAMTLDPTLIDVVEDNLPNLDVLDLVALRTAALPIFVAWAEAVPLLDADGNPVVPPAHSDLAILMHTDASGAPVVDDFAYEFTDSQNNTYWKLASGDDVLDAQGAVIAHPTFAQVMAQVPASGQWTVLTGGEIGFMERYFGQPFPIDEEPEAPAAMIQAMSSFLKGSWTAMNLEAVRLAMQGPLASYFDGIAYDATDNMFRATTDQQLTPMYEAIFDAAPADAAGAAAWLAQWKPVIDIVLGDFDRGEDVLVTYGYMFASMVRAYESVGLPIDIATAAGALGVPSDLIVTGGSTVTGTDDPDILYLHGGDQTAIGGKGMDNYVLGGDFGDVVILDSEPAVGQQDPDILRFTDVKSTDVTATRNGLDLILTINGTDRSVTVTGQFTGWNPSFNGINLNADMGVAQISFSDGVVWNMRDIAWAVGHAQPNAPVITGTLGLDVLDGGASGDTNISGGDGGDIYLFGYGYGHDTIEDNQTNPFNEATDFLKLGAGITSFDVTFSRDGDSDDLQISVNGTNDVLTVVGQFAASYNIFGPMWFDRIEAFVFDDDSSYSWDDVMQLLVAEAKTEGNDVIYGFSYEDVLDGGAGNDTLVGGNENDTYIFGTGYGSDIVHEQAVNILGGMTDTIRFTEEVLPEDVTFTRDGATDDLLITLASGDVLRVKNQFDAFSSGPFGTIWFDRIEYFEFSSTGDVLTYEDVMQRILTEAKTAGNDSIYGYFREDVLDGGAGNDYLAGGGEGDTYVWGLGYGNDTVFDSDDGIAEGDNIDRVVFTPDVAPADVQVSRSGDDLIFTITATGETLTVQDQLGKPAVFPNYFVIEEFCFSDGTVWTLADIRPRLLSEAKTAGDDTIVGFYTADRLDGGAGTDHLQGEGGGDTYVFGRGYGHDTVDAYIVYVTRDQADTIEFTADVAPEDVQISRVGSDLILTISGTDDRLTIEDHFSGLGYWRVENFTFANGTTWTWQDIQLRLLEGTSGDDVLVGGVGNDYLDGGAGNDLLKGQQGDDTYVFGIGYGRDVINDDNNSLVGNAPDRLVFNAGVAVSDLEFVRVGYDDLVIRINGTDDEVTIKHHFDSIYQISSFQFADGTVLSAADVQTIIDNGGSGHVTHRGTAAAETIAGTGLDDIFDGRGGNDTLQGDWGSDTYLYGVGSGNDTIEEDGLSTDVDKVKLVGLNASDVTLGRTGNDLFVTINSTGEVLKVASHFSSSYVGIEQVVFADGTTWDRTTIQAEAWLRGTSGADTIVGSSANETLDGLGGDDTLQGGWGSDTYIYGVGSGNDTIAEDGLSSDVDKVKLVGLNAADVTLGRTGNDLFVTINSTGEVLKVASHFSSNFVGIEQLVFADGTTWDRTAIQAAAWLRGTSGADTIVGSSANETLDGLGGADTLQGGWGSDTYIYGVGSGNDTIAEDGLSSDVDTVKLTGLNASDVTLRHTGNDLFVTITSTGEVLKVASHFSNNFVGIEQIVFADNTTWDRTKIQSEAVITGTSGAETLNGTSANETLVGLGGNDTLNGSGGNDTLDGGADNDTLNGGAGSDAYIYRSGDGNDLLNEDNGSTTDIDTLRFTNLNASDLTFSRSGVNLVIKVNATSQTITVDEQYFSQSANWGIEKIEFADGTSWNLGQITAAGWYRGTTGSDTISGSTAWNDTFFGDLGNDTFNSGAGSDTYIYRSGDGNDYINDENGSTTDIDTLKLTDLNASDLTFSRSGVHLVIKVNATGQTITIDEQYYSTTANWGIEKIEFADGTSWNLATINAAGWYRGTTGADTINGSAWNETYFGDLGNDTFSGVAGSDTYIYRSGDGNDVIDDESGSTSEVDVLKLTDLNASDILLTRNGDHLMVDVAATGQHVEIKYQFYSQSANWGVEKFEFADGTSWNLATINANAWTRGTSGNNTISGTAWDDHIDGGAGNDTITGSTGADTLVGGADNDTLTGGTGNDSFVFRAGFGLDTITDFTAGAGSDDAIDFYDGIFADYAAVIAAASTSGANTIITVDASTKITLTGVALASLHQDDFRFH